MAKLDAVIETYPLPSYWWPQAFMSRARLTKKYDVVFGKNARYPINIIAVAKNPFTARFLLEKRLQASSNIPCQNEYLMADGLDEHSHHLARQDTLQRILSGIDPMTPTLTNQQWWAKELSPHIHETWRSDSPNDVWRILSAFVAPLLEEHGSHAHHHGIKTLGLWGNEAPMLALVDAKLYAHSGWRLKPVSKETEPRLFFSLLAHKIFPVATSVRPLHAVFCGFEPDYWHELVGHVAVLTDQKFSSFYQWCGQVATHLCQEPNPTVKPQDFFKVLLMILEYGIIIDQQGQPRAFGGALTSSYMALQRLKRGFVRTIPFNPAVILKNWFADEFPVRRYRGGIELFHCHSLDEAQHIIATWAG